MQEKGKIPWGYIVPALVILAVIVGVIYIQTRNNGTTTSNVLPPTGNLQFPLSCLSESTIYHVHPWLRIVINGENVTIPGAVGIENPISEGSGPSGQVYSSNTCFEPVHTHDASGLLHIETSTNTNYTLGEFFQIWEATYAYAIINGAHEPIVFNNTDILGYKDNSSGSWKLLVDGGSPPAGDFSGSASYANLVLNDLDYCSSSLPANSTPCYPTDAGSGGSIGNPYWNGGTYPYATGHTIVLEYTS